MPRNHHYISTAIDADQLFNPTLFTKNIYYTNGKIQHGMRELEHTKTCINECKHLEMKNKPDTLPQEYYESSSDPPQWGAPGVPAIVWHSDAVVMVLPWSDPLPSPPHHPWHYHSRLLALPPLPFLVGSLICLKNYYVIKTCNVIKPIMRKRQTDFSLLLKNLHTTVES